MCSGHLLPWQNDILKWLNNSDVFFLKKKGSQKEISKIINNNQMTSQYSSELYWAQQSTHENIPQHNVIFCKKKTKLYFYNSQCMANSVTAKPEQ